MSIWTVGVNLQSQTHIYQSRYVNHGAPQRIPVLETARQVHGNQFGPVDLLFCFVFETGPHQVGQVGLKIAVWTRMALISQKSAYLCLPSARTKGMRHTQTVSLHIASLT